MAVMEEKIKWNLSVFKSAGNAFDAVIEKAHRGDKGVCVTAAVLMFMTADQATRQRFVDLVKVAEGRGLDGTVLEAAQKMANEQAENAAAALTPEQRKALLESGIEKVSGLLVDRAKDGRGAQ